MNDLKFAFRQLLKNPGFTAVAVLTLALGIGANTAIFSIVKAMLLRPLRVENSDRLVEVFHCPKDRLKHTSFWGQRTFVAPADFLDWQNQSQCLESLAAIVPAHTTLKWEEEAERVKRARVSANFFPLLRINPILGRAFRPEEDKPGSEPVAIVSHGFWQRSFGSDPNIIGKVIPLDEGNKYVNYTVVGVMPPRFPLFTDLDLWTAKPFGDLPSTGRGWSGSPLAGVLARLKAGISVEQAQAEMETIEARIFQDKWVNLTVNVHLVREFMVRPARPYLLILFAAVGFILLIACANVANLLLVRAAARGKEIAVRVAIGASRARLIRQFLIESVLLSFLGGALGLAVAFWSIDLLSAVAPSGMLGTPYRRDIPVEAIGLDHGVLMFNLILALLVGVIFGLAPAVRASKPDLNNALKESGRTATPGLGGQWLTKSLVVVQVALSFVLLTGAGLLINTFLRLAHDDLGFDPKNLMVMRLNLSPQDKFLTNAVTASGIKFQKILPLRDVFVSEIVQRIKAIPGLEAVGVKEAGFYGLFFYFEGRPRPKPMFEGWANMYFAHALGFAPGCFEVMGIKLLKGRDFTEQDVEGAPRVRIVNQAFANRYFPNQDPVGKQIMGEDDKPCEIIGIVSDHEARASYAEVGQVREREIQPELYLPLAQKGGVDLDFVIRTTADPGNITSALRKAVREIDHDSPIISVRTMKEVVLSRFDKSRFYVVIFGILASLALVLSAIGVYGVVAYSVRQRTHEIGVRMAMGAQRVDVLTLIVRQGMRLALVGVAIGLAGAMTVTRVLSGLLYGIAPTDTFTFVSVSLFLSGVALFACWLPARRAAKVDPMEALRYE